MFEWISSHASWLFSWLFFPSSDHLCFLCLDILPWLIWHVTRYGHLCSCAHQGEQRGRWNSHPSSYFLDSLLGPRCVQATWSSGRFHQSSHFELEVKLCSAGGSVSTLYSLVQSSSTFFAYKFKSLSLFLWFLHWNLYIIQHA